MLDFIKDQISANPVRVANYITGVVVAATVTVLSKLDPPLNLPPEVIAAIGAIVLFAVTELVRSKVFSPATIAGIESEHAEQLDIVANPDRHAVAAVEEV